ncbi:MAG: hypothetical protein H7246_09260 [Phycisphaerae bacterium]|nr:hypothetical protein [Saprospiraceae bacterium]
MTTRAFFSTLTLIAIFASIISCTKTSIEPATEVVSPTLPSGERIRIHFGTSTLNGCMYSFSNCIWIGWGNATDLQQQSPAFQFDNGDEVSADYGNLFPLTADFRVESQNGLPPQVLKSGFYRFQTSSVGKKMISFTDANLQPVAPLVNPNNPQDNLGQLHNLAMQGIFTAKTKDEIKAVGDDMNAIRKILSAKSAQFLETEAEIVIQDIEQQQIERVGFVSNYDDHQAWLQTSRLSANDRKVLGDILDKVSAMPVNSPDQLSAFVSVMTEFENGLAQNTTLDNPKLLLSAISVAKYSRYYWYWKCLANDEPAARPTWWKADVKGLIEGGIGQALVDSLFAAFTK